MSYNYNNAHEGCGTIVTAFALLFSVTAIGVIVTCHSQQQEAPLTEEEATESVLTEHYDSYGRVYCPAYGVVRHEDLQFNFNNNRIHRLDDQYELTSVNPRSFDQYPQKADIEAARAAAINHLRYISGQNSPYKPDWVENSLRFFIEDVPAEYAAPELDDLEISAMMLYDIK